MVIVKKIIKKLIQIATWLLFILLLFAVYSKIQMIIFKQNYSTLFGYSMFQVASGSMEPALSIDDVILVKVGDDFKIDDIISYTNGEAIITHRVLAIDGEYITVKGDANNTIDDPVKKEIIIGKVIKVFPELKIWQKIFTDPKILVALFLTLLLFDNAFSYKKDTKKTSEKKMENEPAKDKNNDIVEKKEIKKDIIETEELLTLTTQIDLTELTEILKRDDNKKINHETSKNFQELKKLNLEKTKEFTFTELREDKINEYTIRLDLRAIQKNISKKVK